MAAASGSTTEDSSRSLGPGPRPRARERDVHARTSIRPPAGSPPFASRRSPIRRCPREASAARRAMATSCSPALSIELRSRPTASRPRSRSRGPRPTSRRTAIPSSTCSRTRTAKKHGWAVSPRQREAHQAVFHLAEPAHLGPGTELTVRLDHQFEFSYPGFSLGRFRISVTGASTPRARDRPARGDRRRSCRFPPDERTEAQTATLLAHYAATAPETKAARDEIARLKRRDRRDPGAGPDADHARAARRQDGG